MSEDWKQIAIDAAKQCAAYEEEIKHLENSLLLKKKASFADPVLLKESVEALVKVGGISPDQADESMRLMGEDPNAALRAIKALCQNKAQDASTLVKTESLNLDGGKLVGNSEDIKMDERDRAYQAVAKAWGINI